MSNPCAEIPFFDDFDREMVANNWLNEQSIIDGFVSPHDYMEMANTCTRKRVVKFMVALDKLGIPYYNTDSIIY